MTEVQLQEILDFRKVIEMINKELRSKNVFDLEYMLINNSIEVVMEVLNANSDYYLIIQDDQYSNGATFRELLELYFRYVKNKYNSLLIKDGKNDRCADKYYDKLKEPTRSGNSFIQYPKTDIGMIQQDVKKTLMLMREAILAYYKVYHNKKLLAELATDPMQDSEYLEFTIKEEQLSHLLGVTANQLRNNPDFIRLTGNRHMNTVQILEWIVKDVEGNNDLLQYSEDFLTRISKDNFELSKQQFDPNTQSRLLNYHKIRTKSQAFLKYGPFEKVSLVAKIQAGKKLALNSKSNTAMLSKAECFKKYPWAYFGSVQTPKDKYIETLIIDSAAGKKELFKGSTPAIVKGVYTIKDGPSDGSGTSERIFSEEEQFDLFCSAYAYFKDVMDFQKLKEYFLGMSFKLENTYQIKSSNNDYNNTKIKIQEEIATQIYNLNLKSLETLYDDVIEWTGTEHKVNYNTDNLQIFYITEIFEKLEYLTPEQIFEIRIRMVDNQYISQRTK